MTRTIEELERENEFLRGLVASKVMPCHYCGVDTLGKCPYGFPGCSLADDIFIGEQSVAKAWREKYDKRVAELLEANNREVERRRAAEAR